jgi:hypothetical protein
MSTEHENEAPDPIVEAVREKLLQRSRFGASKYGTTLAGNPARAAEWVQHAQEEAMDLANYLERLLREMTAMQNEIDLLSAEKEAHRLALQDVRLMAMRHRGDEWAQQALRVCSSVNVTARFLRHVDQIERELKPAAGART